MKKMTQKERVSNLFEFIMDLLEEKDSKTIVESPIQPNTPETNTPETNTLRNPYLPHDPMFNPLMSDIKPSSISGSLDLMRKIDAIDKERADEKLKSRLIDKVTKPLIKELEDLKANAIKNAIEVKEDEELETIVSEVGNKMGITFENGRIALVSVPTELRDNIPLTEEESTSIILGNDDLPQHIAEKLDVVEESDMITQETPITIPKKKVIKNKTNKSINKNKR